MNITLNETDFGGCHVGVPSAAERFRRKWTWLLLSELAGLTNFAAVSELDVTYLILYSIAIALTVGMTILWAVEICFIFKYVSKKSQRSGKFIWMTGMQPVSSLLLNVLSNMLHCFIAQVTAIAAIIGLCVPRSMKVIGIFTLL